VGRARLIAALVVLYVLAADSFLFYQGGFLNALRRVLLLVVPLALLIAARSAQLPRFVRALLTGAVAGFVWGAIVTAFTGSTLKGPALLLQYFAPFLFLIGAATVSRDRAVRMTMMRVLFWVGTILSVQTVLLFALFLTNRTPSSHTLVLSGNRVLTEHTFGILGYANGVLAADSPLTVYRAQSWFGEPTGLALFLEATLAFGLVTLKSSGRRRRHIAGIGVTALSMFLTFSTGMQFAAIAAIAVLLVGRMAGRYDYTTRLISAAAVLAIGLALVPPTIRALNDFYQRNTGRVTVALGKSPVSSGTRGRVAGETWGFIESHPQGAGFAPLSEGPAADNVSEPPGSAPLFWGLVLGVPGLALALAFFFAILGLVIRASGQGGAQAILATALGAQTIHQISAGSWAAGSFFLLISFVSWELALQRVASTKVAPSPLVTSRTRSRE
jgi:hypothetical protein